MATAELQIQPKEKSHRRKPFASLVRRLTNFRHGGDPSNAKKAGSSNPLKKTGAYSRNNNPYPQSGVLPRQDEASQPSFSASSQPQTDSLSCASLPTSTHPEHDYPAQSNRSTAPTLATNPETISSDAGQSRAATTNTGGRAVSSIDGVGAGSTFSSPNHSVRSLTTTLTTIQSTGNHMTTGRNESVSHSAPHNQESQPNGTMFHQPFPLTASAIPRHLQGDTNMPATYSSATANNLSTDNASIITLASSSKQRRRSMDTDASVRALAPGSVWGGSRESLPLSVLSSNIESSTPIRPAVGGIPAASAERASVYSSSGIAGVRDSVGISSPALASDRNSYYAGKIPADAKSLRSVHTNLKDDARSVHTRELDVASIRSLAPSEVRVAAPGHSRGDSMGASPLASPALPRQPSIAGNKASSLRRGSADWKAIEAEEGAAADKAGFFDESKK